ncbi:predicted protein [Nematostella vectensis]|uniref:tRNA-uridine aminocarboxypropyltransferase n=1 Tax=Nematostella vectensis TaxID=45351 RepID=A7S1X9_NEMVE|nr:predicted protein [Nematostella vectensis]|eukprot:XP_001634382.1 predicted protein [Nematostella vectensis]
MADELDSDDEESVLRGFANLPTGGTTKRPICERCKRPSSVCLCSHLPKELLNISTTIYILQHPKEDSRLLTTVPILSACLPQEKCIIYRDRRYSTSDYPELHAMMKQPNTLVLYPGPNAVNLRSIDLSAHANFNLIVPDGTWKQASGIFHGNPFLQNATQVFVEHNVVSEYVIRTQPTNKSLCTVEAIALALAPLEKNDSFIEILAAPLRALCQYQLDHGAVVHSSKEDKLKNPELA